MNLKLFLNRNGQSLVSTLVSVAIMGIAILGMTSMFSYFSKEMRSINEKLSVLELEKALITTLADGSVCTFEVTNSGAWHPSGVTPPLTFDASKIGSATPPVINLNQILVSAAADSPVLTSINNPAGLNSNSAVVKTIEIANITGPATGNTFSVKFKVSMDTDKLIRSLKPIYIHQTILTSGTGNIKTITGCLGGSALSSGVGLQCYIRPGPAVTCVRTSDGTICNANNYGPGSWNCYAPGSWPADGNWQCSYRPNGVDGAVTCVRTSDGTICNANNYGPGSWNCYAPGSWPN